MLCSWVGWEEGNRTSQRWNSFVPWRRGIGQSSRLMKKYLQQQQYCLQLNLVILIVPSLQKRTYKKVRHLNSQPAWTIRPGLSRLQRPIGSLLLWYQNRTWQWAGVDNWKVPERADSKSQALPSLQTSNGPNREPPSQGHQRTAELEDEVKTSKMRPRRKLRYLETNICKESDR